jgi:hypothetical protein
MYILRITGLEWRQLSPLYVYLPAHVKAQVEVGAELQAWGGRDATAGRAHVQAGGDGYQWIMRDQESCTLKDWHR